jgi:hypothetical protein
MKDLISLAWYREEPIDFEYKEYLLLAYLQKVEKSFQDRKLSPHLLHMEKMIDELFMFQSSFSVIKQSFEKNRYVYFDNIKLEGEDDKLITEIKELVDFSIPQVQTRINYGNKLFNKYKQILY